MVMVLMQLSQKQLELDVNIVTSSSALTQAKLRRIAHANLRFRLGMFESVYLILHSDRYKR
jgi:hypothetical protein